MAVQYIQVKSVSNLFAPAVRAYGNIAIVGVASAGTPNKPILFTNPADAENQFRNDEKKKEAADHIKDPVNNPPVFDLASSIRIAFNQSPGPSLVYGIPVENTPNKDKPQIENTPNKDKSQDWEASLKAVATLDVQFVVLANLGLTAANKAAFKTLFDHVKNVSETGSDGTERMGVVMLGKGSTNTSLVTSELAHERMIYIAHKSDQDAAAAVAGVIAGYEPHISLLLKPVAIETDLFTPDEIVAINDAEGFGKPPKGKGVNWLTSPVLIPGRGIYMGEGYTGDPGGGKKFIDIVRTIDDISFKLKARLIRSIGVLRISRAGLRTVIGLMEAVLEPYVRGDVLGSYTIEIPLLVMLDKDPSTLTKAETALLNDAKANRLIEIQVTVKYQGAIHRLAITLKFE